LFWKLFKKTQWIRPEDADLFTGKAELDAVEWPQKKARNFLEAMWLRFI
jgi:amino acid transporter